MKGSLLARFRDGAGEICGWTREERGLYLWLPVFSIGVTCLVLLVPGGRDSSGEGLIVMLMAPMVCGVVLGLSREEKLGTYFSVAWTVFAVGSLVASVIALLLFPEQMGMGGLTGFVHLIVPLLCSAVFSLFFGVGAALRLVSRTVWDVLRR